MDGFVSQLTLLAVSRCTVIHTSDLKNACVKSVYMRRCSHYSILLMTLAVISLDCIDGQGYKTDVQKSQAQVFWTATFFLRGRLIFLGSPY